MFMISKSFLFFFLLEMHIRNVIENGPKWLAIIKQLEVLDRFDPSKKRCSLINWRAVADIKIKHLLYIRYVFL